MNEQEYKIKGWVARDENNQLHFFLEKPFKTFFQNWESIVSPFAAPTDSMYNPFYKIRIPNEIGFDCRWEDSKPIEVELTIKKI